MKLLQHKGWLFLLLLSFSCVQITGEVLSFPYLIIVTTGLDGLYLHAVLGCIGVAVLLFTLRPTDHVRTLTWIRLYSGILLPLSIICFFLNDKSHYNWPTFSDTYSLVMLAVFCLAWLLFTTGQITALLSRKTLPQRSPEIVVTADDPQWDNTLAKVLLLLEAGALTTFGLWLISGRAFSGSYLSFFTMGVLPRISYSVMATLGVICIIIILLQRSRALNLLYCSIALAGNILLVISVIDFLTRSQIHEGAPIMEQAVPLALLLLFSICTLSASVACILLIGRKFPPRRSLAL